MGAEGGLQRAGLVGQSLPIEDGDPGEAGNPVCQNMHDASDASDVSDASDMSDMSDMSDVSDASAACRNCQSARWVERPRASR
ncbi:MAG: hypothetical protein NTW21_32630, partial [Verrucomicrobia bacterium]|nr:hypothetical protein [Verrucomicrobiota bacterium]